MEHDTIRPPSGRMTAIPATAPDFVLRLARDAADLRAAQELRYRVFVAEMGGDGPGVDHAAGRECDAFDAHCAHLLLIDRNGPGVVGVYRLMDRAGAAAAGRFYSESEFDLTRLLAGGRNLLELGRTCLHPSYRGGTAMYELWQGLARHVAARGVEILFGTASFPGTRAADWGGPVAWLQSRHLAPPDLRARSRMAPPAAPSPQVDQRSAMLATPALIKAYLRLGGVVGEGVFVDHAFNTTDILMILDIARMNAVQRAIYSRGLCA